MAQAALADGAAETAQDRAIDVPAGTADVGLPRAEAQRICIVMNRGSGRKGENGEAERIRALAAQSSGRVEVRAVSGREIIPACKAARDEGFQTIVAAGGDGTIGAVASCLSGTGDTLGVVPLGTFNYFARANGIPLDVDGALDVLTSGRAEPRAVGEVNGALFLNNASIGIYPAILRDREEVYKRWGRSQIGAYWSVIRTVAGFRGGRRFKVTVDGVELRRNTPLLFVAFSDYQIESFGLEGAEHVRDGKLAVYVAPDCGRFGLLKFAALLLMRGMRRGTDFELLAGKTVVVEPADGRMGDRLVARDGEKERMDYPLTFRVRDDALNVLVPSAAPADDG